MAASKASRRGEAKELPVAVVQLSEEVRVLRQAVDELRDDVVWAARQVLAAGYEVSEQPPPRPVDPLAPDADCQPDRTAVQRETVSESPAYCCESPCLLWRGVADAPGIVCGCCGFVVAEEGNIAIWRDDSPEASDRATPVGQQQDLFD